MALPTLTAPEYELTIPSSGTMVKYRPFLVKEEKLLLMALEGGEQKEIINAIKQIVNGCILDDIDLQNMPMFDLEFIFLNLRMKSVGETAEITFKGIDDTDCEECKKVKKITIDLKEVQVQRDPNHTTLIELTKKVKVQMKYPTFDILEKIQLIKDEKDVEKMFLIITKCIQSVYDGKEQTDIIDTTQEEQLAFLESLTQKQFEKIQNFFETSPAVRHKVDLSCKKCGKEQFYTLEGINNFFA